MNWYPSDWLCYCFTVAFRIIAIHICVQPGGAFFEPRQWIAAWFHRIKAPAWVDKPLFDGLACMSGFWGVWWCLVDSVWNGRFINPIPVIIIVCGMLAVLGNFINPKMQDYGPGEDS